MRNLKKQIQKEAEEVSEALLSFVTNFRFPKLKLRNSIILKFALAFLLLFTNPAGTTSFSDSLNGASAMVHEMTPEQKYVVGVREQFQDRLITEINNYITSIAPESTLDPEFLVKKCLEYDTDIIFVLSQALLESHFGTKGKAAETNSVWNVGTFDDGQILYRYPTADASLEPYLKLVNEKYLIEVTPRGDTIYKDLHHLVQDRGYTNYRGARFASARGYENGMRKLMVRIDMETSISFYQDILSLTSDEIVSYFAPKDQSELNYELFTAMK